MNKLLQSTALDLSPRSGAMCLRGNLYWLTDALYSSGQRFQYAYAAVGNRTMQTITLDAPEVTDYLYDAANRLIQVNDETYTWDDNGNLQSDDQSGYTYDQANHLTAINSSWSHSTYTYNGDGARLQQNDNGTVITYTQDLAAPLPVVLQSQAGEDTTQYVYALGTRPLAAARNGGAWEYLLADALGSVRQIVDDSGNVTLAESYEPYGSVLTSTGTASSIFGYAGQQLDTTGLIYLRARYMNPRLGLFLARDPWSGDAMRPGSMNGFSYAGGNPANHVDPTGTCTVLPFIPFISNEYIVCIVKSGEWPLKIMRQFGMDLSRLNELIEFNAKMKPGWDITEPSQFHAGDLMYLPTSLLTQGMYWIPDTIPQPFEENYGWLIDGVLLGGNWSATYDHDQTKVYGAPANCPEGVIGGGSGRETVIDLFHRKIQDFAYDFAIYNESKGVGFRSVGGSGYVGLIHGFSTGKTLERYAGYSVCATGSKTIIGISSVIGMVDSVKENGLKGFANAFAGVCFSPAEDPWELKGTPAPKSTDGLFSIIIGANVELTVLRVAGIDATYAKYTPLGEPRNLTSGEYQNAIQQVRNNAQ